MKVWECGEDDDGLCGEVWAQEGTPEFCPECSFIPFHNAKDQGKDPHDFVKRPKPMGYTVEEARAAENKFLCDIKFYVPTPIPFELVKLSSLPQDKWVGIPVFHPQGQMGDLANWHRYEIGIVTEVYPDPDFSDQLRCRFIMADFHNQSDCIAYGPDNLWVPKPLADHLRNHP